VRCPVKRYVVWPLAVVVVGWILLAGPIDAALSSTKVPTGAIAAHLVGRLVGNNGANGDFEFLGYLSSVETTGLPVFSGDPSEHTAHLTFRSDPFRLTAIANGPVWQVTRLADQSAPVPGVQLYFNATPGADFDQPDSFSTGELLGAVLPHGTQGLLVPSVFFHLEGSVTVLKRGQFVLDHRPFDLRELLPAATLTFVGTPPSLNDFLANTTFSIPFSGALVAADDFHKP
jgi:hypothetical protein